MSRTHNNDMPVPIPTSSVHFYVGVKDFSWSLIFMGEEVAPHTLVIRARIYLYGTQEVYYDSAEILVNMNMGSQMIHEANFNASLCTKIQTTSPTPGMDYQGILEKDCTVHFRALVINNMYVMDVSTLELPVKWVVGARHIVMVDPHFPHIQKNPPVEKPELSEVPSLRKQ